jgi:hypothetical protein
VCSPRSETFWKICQQTQPKLTAFTQRKTLEFAKATQIDCILRVQPCSENSGIGKEKLLQCCLSSGSAAQREI